jgi:hypothetical protein
MIVGACMEVLGSLNREHRLRIAATMVGIEDWCDPVAQSKVKAAVIKVWVGARADELRRCSVRNPVTQAWDEAAARWGHKNGYALNRWWRRYH